MSMATLKLGLSNEVLYQTMSMATLRLGLSNEVLYHEHFCNQLIKYFEKIPSLNCHFQKITK